MPPPSGNSLAWPQWTVDMALDPDSPLAFLNVCSLLKTGGGKSEVVARTGRPSTWATEAGGLLQI